MPAPPPPPRSLAELIRPVSTADFFEEHYGLRPLHAKGLPGHFDGLLTLDDIDRMLTTQSQRLGEVLLARPGETVGPEEIANEIGDLDLTRVLARHLAGSTLILNQLQELHPPIAELCAGLALEFSAPVQANIYVTPPHGAGFEAHFDAHDVIILQTSGSKTWSFAPRSERPADSTPVLGEGASEVQISAGDLLYLPRGTVHAAEAGGDTSVHITLGVLAYRWEDLLHEALSIVALETPGFQDALPPDFLNDAFDANTLAPRYGQLISRLLGWDGLASAVDSLRADFLKRQQAPQRGRFNSVAAASRLEAKSRLVVRPRLAFSLRGEPDSVVIRLGEHEIRVPALGEEAVRFALRGEPFAVVDLPGRLDPASKLALARRLLREGVLVSTTDG